MLKHDHQMIRIIPIFIISFLTTLITPTSSCGDDLYVIRSALSKGLVLDGADESQLRVQHYTGFSTQLWQRVCGTSPDLDYVYIVNNYTGSVLDYDGDTLYLNTKTDVLSQQWELTTDNTIAKVGKPGYVMNVHYAHQTPGNYVNLIEDNDTVGQQFKWFVEV